MSDNQLLLQKERKRLEEGTWVANVKYHGDTASVVGLATDKTESSISTVCTNANSTASVTSAVMKNMLCYNHYNY